MHPSIYREFLIQLAPEIRGPDSDPLVHNEGRALLYVKLRHCETGDVVVFRLTGESGSPERWIEEQVMRRFPLTAAARELRTQYGKVLYRFKPGWKSALGERLFRGLTRYCDSPGARYWAELIPTLPPLLYATMIARTETHLAQLADEAPLREVVKAVHGAWHATLQEAQDITMALTGLQRLALDLSGWQTERLRSLTLMEFAQLKEKAMFARMALSYLTDADWAGLLLAILEPGADVESDDAELENTAQRKAY